MSDKAVEPSEIIVKGSKTPKEPLAQNSAWMRLLARLFDYSIFFLALLGASSLLGSQVPLRGFQSMVPLEFLAWIPIEAALLHFLGTTPGKFLLKIKIIQGRKQKLDFQTALKRSFLVWFRGLGMGIAFISIFCMLVAYHKLKLTQQTSWDREQNITVFHQPVSKLRLVFSTLITLLGFFSYYYFFPDF